MGGYVVRRLLFSVFVLWGAVSVVFVVLRMFPSDPARMILGSDATAEELAVLRAKMGLDQPLVIQYAKYLGGILQGDYGESFRQHRPAMELVLERFPATATLAVSALVVAILIGTPLGIAAALNAHRAVDRVVSVFSLVLQSLPGFWVGIVLILIFARTLKVLPSAGNGSLAHMVLPTIMLALPFIAVLTRMTRSGLLEVSHEGYIQTARAKGLPERVVIMPHAIRNALIPIVTIVGLQFGGLLGGAVITETVFAWPGVGRLLVEAINQRDYNVVQAAILLITGIFVIVNLLVDVLYAYLDPRVRLAS